MTGAAQTVSLVIQDSFGGEAVTLERFRSLSGLHAASAVPRRPIRRCRKGARS